jgi:hypothetical protein
MSKEKYILNEDFDIPGEEEAADHFDMTEDDFDNETLESHGWEYVASKDVYDKDGFRDAYMWYKNPKKGLHRFYFSSDVDYGDPEYYDWESESEESAQEWFDSYSLEDEEEDSNIGLDEANKCEDTNESVGEKITQEKLRTPRGTFDIYKGSFEDFKNDPEYEGWGMWFEHFLPEDADWKHMTDYYKIMSNGNDAIAVLYMHRDPKPIGESVEDKWVLFRFKSGSNPYIAKNRKETERILKKYGDKAEKISDRKYIIDDVVEDKFAIEEDANRIEDDTVKVKVFNMDWDITDEDVAEYFNEEDFANHADYIEACEKKIEEIEESLPNEIVVEIKTDHIPSDDPQDDDEYFHDKISDAVSDEVGGWLIGGYDWSIINDALKEEKRTKFPRGFKLGSHDIQNMIVRNPYNYTIQELRINNRDKTFERGEFSMGRADIELKNRQEYEDIVDLIKDAGYTEVPSDYRSLRNKTRKGVVTDSMKEGISNNMSVEDIAKKHNVSVEDIKAQLQKGIKVEKEHTDDEKKAERIALDHLFEIPDYYDRLNKMEKGALKEETDDLKFIGNAQIISINEFPRIGDSFKKGTVVSINRKPNQEGYRIYEVGVAEDPDHEFVTSDDGDGLDGVNTSHWTFAVKPSLKEDTKIYTNLDSDNMVNEIRTHLKNVTNIDYIKAFIDTQYKYHLIDYAEKKQLYKEYNLAK